MRRRRVRKAEAELDITSFMNLMIILVPVLLMNMVFSHITVLNLKLPDLAPESTSTPEEDKPNESLEIVIQAKQLIVNYPAGSPVKIISQVKDPETGEMTHDFDLLSRTLQQIKRTLRNNKKDKKDILILSQRDTDYQTIVKAMDTARSFKAVVAASVVDAELFPLISLGDAPVSNRLSARGQP